MLVTLFKFGLARRIESLCENNFLKISRGCSSFSTNSILSPLKHNGRTRKYAKLRVYGPDNKGIVASFSHLLYKYGCDIVGNISESSIDNDNILFFQRLVFDYKTADMNQASLQKEINTLCKRLGMQSILNWGKFPKRVAIMVSKYDHCLWEILLRHRAGELDCDIVAIISNHHDHLQVATMFGIPYHVIEITKENKKEQEQKEMDLLKNTYAVDLVVLARYMQVLSDSFVNSMSGKIINIHHSFLPAFKGSKPYHRAHHRGVKLIGATAHYATSELDEGPIIEQDLTRITHRDTIEDLIRKGRTLEKNVLVQAIKAHLEDRIIIYKHKCVLFSE